MGHAENGKRFAKGAYCLGKIVYGKGWEELLTLLDFHQRHTHERQAAVNHPTIDAYGSGEAFEHVRPVCHFWLACLCGQSALAGLPAVRTMEGAEASA